MRARLVVVVLLVPVAVALLALAACGGSNSTTSTSPGDEVLVTAEPSESAVALPAPTVHGTILFANVVEEEADADICIIKADGTGLKTLSGGPDWNEHPSWSADGTRIAFDGGVGLHTVSMSVWVMNASGSGKVELARGYHPHWSPDGKRIVFVRAMTGPRSEDIFVMNADGSGVRCIVDLKDSDSHPVWAKAGKIVFLRYEDLYSVNPDGSGLVRLTKREEIGDYAISPDGGLVAYEDGERVVVVPAVGGGHRVTLLKPVSDYIAHDPNAVADWIPGGRSLVVASSDADGGYGSRLYVVNANGGGLSAVPGIETALDPQWRPR